MPRTVAVVERLRPFWQTRRAAIVSIAAMQTIGGCGCVIAYFFPLSPRSPRLLELVFGCVLFVSAASLWYLNERVNTSALQLLNIAGVGVISAIIASSVTYQGVVIAAFTYQWSAIYAAYNLSRKSTYLVLTCITIGFGAGLLVTHLPKIYIIWPLATGTFWTTGIILERLQADLRRQAETDALTGMLNRRGFIRHAVAARAVSERGGRQPVAVVIDLDGFKAVNDLEGHEVGDRTLASIATAWKAQLGAGALIGRFGGDEFVLLVFEANLVQALDLVERLRLAHPIAWSSGVAQWSDDENLEDCLRRADKDLYRNKATRRPVSAPGIDELRPVQES